MASLALKAIAYGAEKIPDKVFEAIPGGYFRAKEEQEREKKRKNRSAKRRSQSERRSRRRSPTPSDYSDYSDYTDYYHSDEEADRERHRRHRHRKDDRNRGRDREGRRRHRSRSRSRENDGYVLPPPKADRSRSLGAPQQSYYPPPPPGHVQQVHAGTPAGNLAHPQPHNPAIYTQHKPYNPADYAPANAMTSHEHYGGQPYPASASVAVPGAAAPQQNGYYNGQPQPLPPPPAQRPSRASSVESRGYNPHKYVPHGNVYQNSPPTAGTPPHQAVYTPPYVPQSSSPYKPNYSPSYSPVLQGHSSMPVSRKGSISQGGSGAHSHRHDRHRRHSIANNPNQDPRYPYRPHGTSSSSSSRGSHRSSMRNSLHGRISEEAGRFDGVDETDMRKRHRRGKAERRYGGHGRGVGADGYDSY